jgi:hypothetical protein
MQDAYGLVCPNRVCPNRLGRGEKVVLARPTNACKDNFVLRNFPNAGPLAGFFMAFPGMCVARSNLAY